MGNSSFEAGIIRYRFSRRRSGSGRQPQPSHGLDHVHQHSVVVIVSSCGALGRARPISTSDCSLRWLACHVCTLSHRRPTCRVALCVRYRKESARVQRSFWICLRVTVALETPISDDKDQVNNRRGQFSMSPRGPSTS